MVEINSGLDSDDDCYTLLCVRADGVAPVVDLVASMELHLVRSRALDLLKEHASCETVEVWRSGVLIQRVARS